MVLLAATAASPSTRARYGLPCPVEPLPLCLPADSLTPGANLAHDTRCPAVGNRVMSARFRREQAAARLPTPGILSSRSTAPSERGDHLVDLGVERGDGALQVLQMGKRASPAGRDGR